MYPPYTPTIEPKLRSHSACAAVVRQTSSVNNMRWIMIPCDTKHADASYICESRSDPNKIDDVTTTTTILRSYTECSAERFILSGWCLFIHSVNLPVIYNVTGICGSQKADVFELPKFIISKPAIEFTSEEQFVAHTLLSMNHRWPRLVDHETINPEFLDKIFIQLPHTKDKYTCIHYSTSLGYFMLNESFHTSSSETLHIACQAALSLANQKCSIAHYTCHDGTCILSHYVCDGIDDCPDGSDEANCDICVFANATSNGPMDCYKTCFPENCTCNELYFHCFGGGCVPWSRVCDGGQDCPNEEDELTCHFVVDGIQSLVKVTQRSSGLEFLNESGNTEEYSSCTDGQNISQLQINDLVPDCSDQSDENLYDDFLRNGSSMQYFRDRILCKQPEETTCEKNFLGVCYPRHLYCVYETVGLEETTGCRNGGHLKECKFHKCPSQFKCPDAYCVPVYVVCNGRPDCPNGEDEVNCNSVISCPGYLLCRYDHVCVHPYDVWNGHVKCLQSEDDKALADYFPCPKPCQCLGNAIFCRQARLSAIDTKPLFQTKSHVYTRSLIMRNISIDLGDIVWEKSSSVFLIQLEISNSNLSRVEKHHFPKMTYLRTLNLSYNSIVYISGGALSNLRNLESFDLNYNLLTMLNSSIFSLAASKLQVLSLKSNRLFTIEACILSRLQNLKSLDLSRNKISSLENLLCENNTTSLRSLILSENPLRQLHLQSLQHGLPDLRFLNATPAGVCCFIPHVKQCYPQRKFFAWSCKHLFMTPLFRTFYWVLGILVLMFESMTLVWCIHEIKLKTSIINVLSLLSVVFGWFHGFYFVIISAVDHIFANIYSFYHEMWQSHVACTMINILVYTVYNMGLFVSVTVACTRMIAIVFPLKAAHISMLGVLFVCSLWFIILLLMGCMPYTVPVSFIASEDGRPLGLGLLLPSVVAENWPWSVGAVLCPMSCKILALITFYIVALRSVRNSINRFDENSKHGSQKPYMNTVGRIISTLVLNIFVYTPLFTVHILKLCGYMVNRRAAIIITSSSLFIVPSTNLILHLSTSSGLKKVIIKILR